MLIGAMNNPARNVLDEIKWMKEMGLDFIDLTLEPPLAAVWTINPKEIRLALQDYQMKVIGHTAYYLPLASPFESIRKAVIDELKSCLEVFAELGASWMNIHPDYYAPMHDRQSTIQRNINTLQECLIRSRECGVGLMIENLPGNFNTKRQLSELLDPLPELGLHLDIGHSNLMVDYNTAEDIIFTYGTRLRHVHLHDNKGGTADLHLPLGTGNVDVQRHVRTLKTSGYDATITLEVFTPDRHYLSYSRDYLRRVWNES
jgi:sugar phosphate isomerase/epimerase